MLDLFIKTIEQETSSVAYWGHGNGPRVAASYFVLDIISSIALGTDLISAPVEDSTDPEAGIVTSRGQREVTVSITAFTTSKEGADPRSAMDRLGELRNILRKSSLRQDLQAKGLSFRGDMNIFSTPQLMGTRWRPSATLEVRLGIVETYTDDLGIIETVDGQYTVEGGNPEDFTWRP